jgi:hypothetical protein
MGVERVEVLLAASVEALGPGIDPLLDRCVRDLFAKTANLQVSGLLGSRRAGILATMPPG